MAVAVGQAPSSLPYRQWRVAHPGCGRRTTRRHLKMNIQIIEREGTPEYVVIPYAEFERLCEAAETLDDIQRYSPGGRRKPFRRNSSTGSLPGNTRCAFGGSTGASPWPPWEKSAGSQPPPSPGSKKASVSHPPPCSASSPLPCAATWTTCFPHESLPQSHLQLP